MRLRPLFFTSGNKAPATLHYAGTVTASISLSVRS